MTPSAFGDTRSPAGAKRGLSSWSVQHRIGSAPGSAAGAPLFALGRGGAIISEQFNPVSLPNRPQLTGC